MDGTLSSNKLDDSPTEQERSKISSMALSKGRNKTMVRRGAIMGVNDILLSPKKENK